MIRSVLLLQARAGKSAALEEFYAHNDVLERARRFPGCRNAQLLRSIQGSAATHVVIADWETADDYQRWVEDPWRASSSRQLVELLDTDPSKPLIGGVFELIPEQ